MIRIERPSRWADRARTYKVILDGREVGRIGNKQTLELYAAPGPHELYLAIDWCRSPSVAFEVPEGDAQPIAFRCSPAMASWRQALAILYISVWRGRYIRLERVG